MGIVARELRVAFKMLAVKTSWSRFGRPAGLYSDIEDRFGIHGGDFETSVMLHFRPDLVDMAKAEDFASSVAARRAGIRTAEADGNARLRLDRLRPQPERRGRRGLASATAEKGRLTAEHQADGFIRLLKDVRKAKLADWLK